MAVAVTLSLVGCSSSDPEPAATGEAPTTTASPFFAARPSPEPTVDEIDYRSVRIFWSDTTRDDAPQRIRNAAQAPNVIRRLSRLPLQSTLRSVRDDAALNDAVLAVLAGPGVDEAAAGLAAPLGGFEGMVSAEIERGVATIVLSGTCSTGRNAITVADLVAATALDLDEVDAVKVIDGDGETERPGGRTSSLPRCRAGRS